MTCKNEVQFNSMSDYKYRYVILFPAQRLVLQFKVFQCQVVVKQNLHFRNYSKLLVSCCTLMLILQSKQLQT